jgi:uncharacterized protein
MKPPTQNYHRLITQSAAYCAITFGIALGVALCWHWLGESALLLSMFAPLTAVILCRSLLPEGRPFRFSELGLASFGLKYWPLAFILPIAVILPGYLLVWNSGIATSDFSSFRTSALPSIAKLILSIAAGGCIAALGEEVGWRGYLLPRLASAIGHGKAGFLTGFLHGLFHLPLMLLTPFYHNAGAAGIVAPLFLIALTLSGPIYAHLRFASGSILPIALMHRAWNTYWEGLSHATTTDHPALVAYLSGEAGVVTILALALVNLWLLWRKQDAPAVPAEKLAGAEKA